MSINVGDRVPSFELPDQHGNAIRFADLLGKGPVVLYFYPKDETPGCTAEACSFRDTSGDFAEAGATIVGISSDDVESHRQFALKHDLNFTLLADEGGRVRSLFDIPRQMLGLVEGRVTYVIDRDGVVKHRFDSLIRARKHVDEALATVRQLSGKSTH